MYVSLKDNSHSSHQFQNTLEFVVIDTVKNINKNMLCQNMLINLPLLLLEYVVFFPLVVPFILCVALI